MKELSTKPYLIRAIYEWCNDSGLTPYLSVRVNAQTRVPMAFVKKGEIVLNISQLSTHRLTLGDDLIEFSARFNGSSQEISVPMEAVAGIFAKESGQGLMFPIDPDATPGEKKPDQTATAKDKKSWLQVVK